MSETLLIRASLSGRDRADLQRAVAILEHPGLAARLSNTVGSPLERGMNLLPDSLAETVQEAAHKAISAALDVAVSTLADDRSRTSKEGAHKLLSGMSGALGGFFGAAGLVVELPLSTTLMLRSIAAIARSEGEALRAPETRLACLEVFALGGNSASDDAAESGYYATRIALAGVVADALRHLAEHGLAHRSAPALLRLIAAVAARFGVTVSQKAAVQWIPALGALGGASLNLLFMSHFQAMARGHFIVRRLEREYGSDLVQLEYERLRRLN